MQARPRKLTKRKRQVWRRIWIGAGAIFTVCCVCVGAAAVFNATGSWRTPTPIVEAGAFTIEQAISYTQSAVAPATATVTTTATNTLIPFPTDTLQPPSATAVPTRTLEPTSTSTTLPTEMLVVIVPSQPAAQAVCSCRGDTLNCDPDFDTHAEAQACFDYCQSIVGYDVHDLDRDNDGVAYQNLP